MFIKYVPRLPNTLFRHRHRSYNNIIVETYVPLSLSLSDWLQLTGLIHDIGKLLALWGEPQWAAVGDTFPVGCAFSDKCVFHEQFQSNPDYVHPVYRYIHCIAIPSMHMTCNYGVEWHSVSCGCKYKP